MNEKDALIFKIVLIGDGEVGKTSLRKSFMGQTFRENYIMTVGADFSVKHISYEGYAINLIIWDLAGQPRFKDVRGSYYYGAYGAVVVFDISRPESFTNSDFWIKELIKNCDDKLVPMILLGNKSDLRNSDELNDGVNSILGQAYAATLSEWAGFTIPYFETSAKEGENVEKAFNKLISCIYNRLGL